MAEAKDIHEAIANVMAEVDYVQKTKAKEGTGIKYAIKSEEAILDKIRPKMLKQGIVMYPGKVSDEFHSNFTTTRSDGTKTEWNRIVARFTYVFFHVPSKTFVEVQMLGEGADTSDKASNKAMTVSKKYAILEAFLLITGNDPDEEESPERVVPPQRPFPADVLISSLRHTADVYAKKQATITDERIAEATNKLLGLFENPNQFTVLAFGTKFESLEQYHWLSIEHWLTNAEFAKAEAKLLLEAK